MFKSIKILCFLMFNDSLKNIKICAFSLEVVNRRSSNSSKHKFNLFGHNFHITDFPTKTIILGTKSMIIKIKNQVPQTH